MVYCFNPKCPHPENPEGNKFCSFCGTKLFLNERFTGKSLIQHGVKGRTLLGIDHGTTPASECIIKQSFITKNTSPNEFLSTFRQNLRQLKKLGDRPEFPGVLYAHVPKTLQDANNFTTVVFEKIDGESLLQQMSHLGTFNEKSIRDFLRQLLPLLQTVHDHHLVHRDISPSNLIFTPTGQWAIVDFTAAKVTSKMASAKPGTLVGSGIYTAPEQLRGRSYPVSDLYSLGVICLELLTRVHPFELFSAQEDTWVWRDYLMNPIDDELAGLLDHLVCSRPGDRPISARRALDKLEGKDTLPKVNQFVEQKSKSFSEQSIEKAKITASQLSYIKETTIPQGPKAQWFCFKTFLGHSGYISGLNFDQTGEFLASACADQTIRVWNVENRWEVACLRGHKGIVSSAIFIDHQVISGSWDYTVRIWNWRTGTESDRLEQRRTWIQSLAALDHNHKLATLGADQHIALWDLKTKTFLQSWHSNGSQQLHSDGVSSVLVSASEQEIFLWQNDQIISTLSGHLSKINTFKISPNGKFLISAGDDKSLMLWSVREQKCDKVYTLQHVAKSLAIFPDKRFFAVGDDQGMMQIWQLGQEQPVATLPGHKGPITAIAVSPDNSIIATGSQDKTIKLWRFGIQ